MTINDDDDDDDDDEVPANRNVEYILSLRTNLGC